MKKLLAFSLIVILSSPILVGCKSGTSCFTRNGSRVPILGGSSASSYDDSAVASSTGARVVNAYPTNEVVMMNAANAYSECAPCAQAQCNPCDPCTPTRAGSVSGSGYPSAAGAYGGL